MSDSQAFDNMRKPPWLKIRPNFGPVYTEIKALLKQLNLHTVCQEASCPNIGECFSARNCRFCDIKSDIPLPPDCAEPSRVAQAVEKLHLQFAVVTSVTRDDLPDGGAGLFARTIAEIRSRCPECQVEVLIPDLGGKSSSLEIVLQAKPQVLAHNVETVPELYSRVRPKADYQRSLKLLKRAAQNEDNLIIKSGMMVGLGETTDQIMGVLKDIAAAGCQIFTIGQYLSPSKDHLPVTRFYTPAEFSELKNIGESFGIGHVESGPLVRSSYMAHRQAQAYQNKLQPPKIDD